MKCGRCDRTNGATGEGRTLVARSLYAENVREVSHRVRRGVRPALPLWTTLESRG